MLRVWWTGAALGYSLLCGATDKIEQLLWTEPPLRTTLRADQAILICSRAGMVPIWQLANPNGKVAGMFRFESQPFKTTHNRVLASSAMIEARTSWDRGQEVRHAVMVETRRELAACRHQCTKDVLWVWQAGILMVLVVAACC
jgi:hypothetical protein